jgi:hypothetical protein
VALKPEHLPLPCSLRERVTQRFAPENAPLSSEALSRDELVAYLAQSKDTDNSPLSTIQRRAAKAGRSAHLFPADHATLAWVCEAFDDWESNYPLESPLREQVHRLLPLAVAMALTDERFFVVGAHPLHQLLDSLQRGAVGWQARLDRAGQMLQQRVDRSVEKALEWFNDRGQDIAAIDRELEAANERDAARAQRMVQRLAETEEARLKTLSARREAAKRINGLLEDFELPSAIGEFVKGAWYDSAQLVLVKHGEDSQDWQEMQRTTRHLLESVQPLQPGDEVERDRRAQMLRLLPAELRRWLLSLEHDSEATDGAIGLVEYAHLRMQHGHQLELARIPPLPVENPEQRVADEEEPLTTGQWYRFSDENGELRAQLVLQLENGQHLLFTNFVGLKALDLPTARFPPAAGRWLCQPPRGPGEFQHQPRRSRGHRQRRGAARPGGSQLRAREHGRRSPGAGPRKRAHLAAGAYAGASEQQDSSRADEADRGSGRRPWKRGPGSAARRNRRPGTAPVARMSLRTATSWN